MGQLERLVLMAEDELTHYSTDARKIEKLRQKIGLSVSLAEQRQVKEALLAEMPTDSLSQLLEKQRYYCRSSFLGYCWTRTATGNFFRSTVRLYCHGCRSYSGSISPLQK